MILGPFAEKELRQALQISNGDIGGPFEPISIVVFCIVGCCSVAAAPPVPPGDGSSRDRSSGRRRHPVVGARA